jgi:hypothetical protein
LLSARQRLIKLLKLIGGLPRGFETALKAVRTSLIERAQLVSVIPGPERSSGARNDGEGDEVSDP